MIGLLAFALAFAGEFFSETWSIYHTSAVTNLPLNRKKMFRRVWKATLWAFLLGVLGHADFLGVFQFHLPYLWIFVGSQLGIVAGTQWTLWKKWKAAHKRLKDNPRPSRRKLVPPS